VSGLSAYRHINCYPNLKATLFESLPNVGGIWSRRHPNFRPEMTTNISQHTVTFSDLAWPKETGPQEGRGRDVFPYALDVEKYQQLYFERYVHEEDVRLCTRVTAVDHRDGKWNVTSCKLDSNGTKSSETIAEEFEYLVIASGFFSTPYTPPLPGILGAKASIQHSAEFRLPESYQGQNVAIIGGSFSAAEIAGLLVPYAANIYHVHSKPFFPIFKYLPTSTDTGKPHFLPLDLVFNRRSTRTTTEEQILPTPDINRKKVAFFSSMFPPPPFPVNSDEPPLIGISDYYTVGLRAGVITPYLARLESLDPNSSKLKLSSGEETCAMDTVIFCTGYSTSLPFLPSSLQAAIGYQHDNQYVPFLAHHLVLHPDLPQAGFVGAYRGAYFAVIELQARYLAALFAGEKEWPSKETMQKGVHTEESIRFAKSRPQFPHGDYGGLVEGYARLLELPSPLKVASEPKDKAVADQILAVNYPLERTSDVEVIESDLLETLLYSERGGWVLAAVFRSWCGRWTMHRDIRHHASGGMDGSFDGIATFYPRPPSVLPTDPSKLPPSYPNYCSGLTTNDSVLSAIEHKTLEKDVSEYLYHEIGTFTTSTGVSFQAHKKYIYRYQPLSDSISVWFCNSSSSESPDQGELDYWFHDIVLEGSGGKVADGVEKSDTDANGTCFLQHDHKEGWRAAGTKHLCVQDRYRPAYKFCFRGAEVQEFGIRYDVEGPKKGYVSEAWFERAT
jgi:hypothetical protein